MADPTLLIAMLLSIAVLMVLILRFKAHAIFALLAAGVVLGLAAGMKPARHRQFISERDG